MASTEETTEMTEAARDDLEFLASSWNRFDVLSALVDGPRSRDELRDISPVSRVTLSRILSDLEDRGWIARQEAGYETTTAGKFVADEVTRLLDNVRTLNRLGENVEWIRLDQFDFDLSCLDDANIIMPSWDDFSAQTTTIVELVYETSVLKGIGTGLDREFIKAVVDATLGGDLSPELIFTSDVIEAVNDEPDLSRLFRDLSDASDADVYRYNGEQEVMELGIHQTPSLDDDVVMLCGEYEDGAPPGTVESTDPLVREWAESYFEARRAESHRLKAAVFTP